MLMKEIRFIQDRFVNSKRARSVEDISRPFAKLVFQGKLTAAIKLLDKENSSGLLNLSDEVLAQLKEKHPVPAEIEEECLLHGPVDLVPAGIFDLINEQRIFDSALKTKGSAGPSGLDAELYRRILCSKNFAAEGRTLREEIATLTKNLLIKHPACKMTPNGRGRGKRRTRRGSRGNGKLGGAARDAQTLLISLTFLSLAVKKANYRTLIWSYVSDTNYSQWT